MKKTNPALTPNSLSRHRIQAGNYQHLGIEAAHEILPMVRKITRKAVKELDPIQQRLNTLVPSDPRILQVKHTYAHIVKSWAGKIERLGLKVLGLWQVGFDGGSGWYGWQYPERSIRYFLEYDALFSDRCLIREIRKRQAYTRISGK